MADMLSRVWPAGIVWVLAALLVLPAGAAAQDSGSTGTGPRLITGSYETTNPIYATLGARTGVALYDITGQVLRDFDFIPAADTQVLGTLRGTILRGDYTLELPTEPQGIWHDFDGDALSPPAVQVFAASTYIDFLGDAHINRGETPLDLSVRLEPLTYNVVGGHAIVWAANEGEAFPAGFGPDGAGFTDDDPLLTLPQGWSVVSLETEPFSVLRQAHVDVPIVESFGGLNDYSDLDYHAAWEALFERTVVTYPFSDEKAIDWAGIYDEITPLVARAQNDIEYHLTMAYFGGMIPDTHVGYVSVPVMQRYLMGGVGIAQLGVTDEGEVVVLQVTQGSAAAAYGIRTGTRLLAVGGMPALQVLDATPLLLMSASTPHGRRFLQAATMLQGPVGSQLELTWQTDGEGEQTALLLRTIDVASIMESFGGALLDGDALSWRVLDSGLGYIKINSFALQVSDADRLFGAALEALMAAGVSGIILDLRDNSGGLVQLSMAMAGRFFPDNLRLLDFHYADGAGAFAYRGFIEILAGEPYYDGPVAVLVNEMTGSAGDLFAYALALEGRALLVGHTPTGGSTGEVGDGQYALPGGLSMQIPTGRPIDPDTGQALIEGAGVAPDILVPRTLDSMLAPEDAVLQAAAAALLANP